MRGVYFNQTIDLMPPTNTPMTRWGFQTSSLKYSKTAAKKVSCLRFLILWKSHFSIYKNAQNPEKTGSVRLPASPGGLAGRV
jgi:hypothetical protein